MSEESLRKELEDTIQQLADMTGMEAEKITEELDKAESIDDILIAASEFFK
jgi:hypothetical protein